MRAMLLRSQGKDSDNFRNSADEFHRYRNIGSVLDADMLRAVRNEAIEKH